MQDELQSAEALSAIYENYMDPATKWFPEKFMRHLLEICAAVYAVLLRNGGDAVDLGASRGFHALRMRQCLGAAPGKVVAVEANAELAKRLEELAAGDSRIVVLHKAVVAQPTQSVDFTVSSKYTALGSVIPNYIKDRFPKLYEDAEVQTYSVEAITVDQIIENQRLNNLKFLKCDVEGIDFEVIDSTRRLFPTRAGLSVEMSKSPVFKSFLATLRNNGYFAYDCFMNRLDEKTWFHPTRCPIDRFALPAELDYAALRKITDMVRERWEIYRSKAD